MVEPNEQQEKARDKVREVLKASGKDPDKLMPKGEPQTPETPIAGAVSSTDNPKTAEEIAKENQETESRAAEAQKVEDTKKAEEDKQLLDTKDEDLSDEQKAKKKEVVALQETQKQADKDSNVQKRIDELVGEMKSLKHKDSQSVQRVVELEAEVKKLRGTFDRDPGKEDAEIRKLETERLDKFSKEDEGKPREERRELSKAELEEWLVDDITAASEWLARRELRRDKDRTSDREQMGKNASDAELKAKVDLIVKRQAESKVRVDARHPELNVQSRVDELKKEGKNQTEIQAIIWAENPKAKLAAEIIKENPEKYWSAEDGPELVAKELEKRMNGKKSSDVDAEKEEREAAEEAERQRQANIDTGLNSTRAPITPSSQEKDPIYQKQFAIWKKAFPNETVAQVKARLDKRLNVRRESGVA